MLHIVLLEPEIPQNTGNISRTCAVTGAELHLIGPMGFSIGDDAWLLFGKETHGLPEPLLAADYARTVRIPMREGARCLNLSNAVAVMAYEVLRQQDFAGLQETGALTGRPD